MKIRFRLPFDISRPAALTTPLRLLLATTAAFWMGATPAQVPVGTIARTSTELRFRDFFSLPPATVVVYLDPSQRGWAVPHVRGLVSVCGVLRVGRFEESDGCVSRVRLQLDEEAARGMNGLELAGYLHSLKQRRAAKSQAAASTARVVANCHATVTKIS